MANEAFFSLLCRKNSPSHMIMHDACRPCVPVCSAGAPGFSGDAPEKLLSPHFGRGPRRVTSENVSCLCHTIAAPDQLNIRFQPTAHPTVVSPQPKSTSERVVPGWHLHFFHRAFGALEPEKLHKQDVFPPIICAYAGRCPPCYRRWPCHLTGRSTEKLAVPSGYAPKQTIPRSRLGFVRHLVWRASASMA